MPFQLTPAPPAGHAVLVACVLLLLVHKAGSAVLDGSPPAGTAATAAQATTTWASAVSGGRGLVATAAARPTTLAEARERARQLLADARSREAELLAGAAKVSAACCVPGGKARRRLRHRLRATAEAGTGISQAARAVFCPDAGSGTPCSGHGECGPLRCVCNAGWSGPACATPAKATPDQPPSELLTIVHAASPCAKQELASTLRASPGLASLQLLQADLEDATTPPGARLNELLRSVTTPYALVLWGNIVPSEAFDPARAIAAMEGSGVVVAGGVVESPNNDREPGLIATCHAMRVVNYTLSTVPGWRGAWRECLLCDYVSQGFVVDVAAFVPAVTFNKDAVGRAVGATLFQSTLTKPIIPVGMCPLAIHLRELDPGSCKAPQPETTVAAEAAHFRSLGLPVADWHLPDGHSVHSCCASCGATRGKGNAILGPCDYAELVAMLLDVTAMFDKFSIPYSAAAGTLLGMVKTHGVIPWDYDLDLKVFTDSWAKTDQFFGAMAHELRREYGISIKYSRTGCAATVLTLQRGRFDMDTYVSTLDTTSHIVKGKNTGGYGTEECLRQMAPGKDDLSDSYLMSWRGVARHHDDGRLYAPLARIYSHVHGRWISVQGYYWTHVLRKFGESQHLFHVTRAMAKVDQMTRGTGGYGTKALTRTSHYCSNVKDAGCLDGWVWLQDWREWDVRQVKVLPSAGG